MGNRDIWKISRRPSSTSSYQGNMYILIATESARNPVKKGAKVWSGFAVTFSFRNVFFFAPFWSSKCSNRPCSGFLALQGSLKCHGIAVKTTKMAVVQLPKSLENRSTTAPLVGIPGRPCLRWTSRNVFFVTQRKKTKSCWSHEALTRCTLESSPKILLSAARMVMRKDDVCLLEIDQVHAKEVMYHASSYDKVHQPQVPGLRCHCQQGECQKSFWSFNDWGQWQLPDMAFKCLTSMIEEWITDAYCIMSLLNHIVPLICMASYCEMKYRKKAVRGYSLKSSSHMIKRHFWHEIGLSQT